MHCVKSLVKGLLITYQMGWVSVLVSCCIQVDLGSCTTYCFCVHVGVTVEWLQTQGFTHPLVFHNPTGLGLRYVI